MSRSSVFDNLVTNENFGTELLCNTMRFDSLRRALVALFFTDECSSKIGVNDIDTQVSLDEGRPDLVVENDDVYAFIELKSGRAPELVLRERSQCERLLRQLRIRTTTV